MVTTNRLSKQPGEPRASLLVEQWAEQTFAIYFPQIYPYFCHIGMEVWHSLRLINGYVHFGHFMVAGVEWSVCGGVLWWHIACCHITLDAHNISPHSSHRILWYVALSTAIQNHSAIIKVHDVTNTRMQRSATHERCKYSIVQLNLYHCAMQQQQVRWYNGVGWAEHWCRVVI